MNYMITLKRNAIDYTSIDDLKHKYRILFAKVPTQCYCIELDSRKRLHLHSLVKFKKTPYYKKYQTEGWTVYFSKVSITILQSVVEYINKNKRVDYQHGMEIISYSHYQNMFT